MKQSGTFTIGALAKTAGVGIQTVRFYEREGLINQPPRGAGYRQYSSGDVKQIKFIKRAQELGFTLREVKALLGLQTGSKSACGDVRKRAEKKRIEVEEKIRDLKRMQRSLAEISGCCVRGKATHGVCSILDCFEGNC